MRMLRLSNRRGFTLLEMIIAITLTLMIFGAVVPFFRAQANAVSDHSGRFDAQQNALFGLAAIERELRIAGVNMPDAQPLIVQASSDAITFNVDLVTNSALNLGAVYVDPDADPRTVGVMLTSDTVALPNSTRRYPDSTYRLPGGAPSTAETISFWVTQDPSAPAVPPQYMLMRRVNAAAPEIVVRGLVLPPGEPVFRYYKVTSTGAQLEIPQASLPLFHVAMHDAVDDIGASRMTDSIRIVRVRLTSAYRDPRRPEVRRAGQRDVRIMNSGLMRRSTCGEVPLLSAALTVAIVAGTSDVTLSWPAARDETGGERDVERYAVYRRANSDPFGEPLTSIAAGQASYTAVDANVPSGTWVYGVAAQDCSNQLSDIASSSQVIIP